MAQTTLVNRYKHYKQGTTRLVEWLVHSARDCQDVDTLLPALPAAKEAAKQAKRHQSHASTNVKVSTSQLLRLANVVVKASTPVPRSIIRTTRAVIDGRQVCADVYTSLSGTKTDANGEQQNESHQYFIDVLKQILHLLESAPSMDEPAASRTAKQHNQTTSKQQSQADRDVVNLFSCLELDEPAENALETYSCQKPAVKQVRFELEDSDFEKSFAIWCLLEDLRDLRHEVRNTWTGYTEGRISFSTAALTTTVAICMTRFAEDEFKEQHNESKPLAFREIFVHMNVELIEAGKDVWICSRTNNKPVQIAHQKFGNGGLAQLLIPRAYRILQSFWQQYWTDMGAQGPLLIPGITEYFMRYHPFGAALEGIMPELKMHFTASMGGRLLEEFMTGLLDMMEKPTAKHPTIWMVSACQMNMDIFDIVGSSIEAALADYRKRIEVDQASIYSFLTNWDLKTACKCEGGLVSHALETRGMLNHFAKDPYSKDPESKVEESVRHQKASSATNAHQPFKVYRALPVAAGTSIHLSAHHTHNVGIQLCHWGNLVLSVAYLYKAALKAGLLKQQWPDMEFVIATHSKSRPLVLEPDPGTSSMAKCFGIALGVKLKAFKKGQRPRPPKRNIVAQHVRRLSIDWPLQKAMNDFGEKKVTRDGLWVKAAIESVEQLSKVDVKDDKLREICDQYKKSGKLTPSQLLRGFQEVYIADEMDLKFDYISFFFNCSSLLDSVRDSLECCLAALQKQYSADFSWAHELVYAILWDKLEDGGHNKNHHHKILPEAAKILAAFIDEQGSNLVDRAREQSSGYTAPPPTHTTAVDADLAGLPPHMQLIYGLLRIIDDQAAKGADAFCSSADDFNRVAASYRILLDLLRSPTLEPREGTTDPKVLRLAAALKELSPRQRAFVERNIQQLDQFPAMMRAEAVASKDEGSKVAKWSGKWKGDEHAGEK